MGKHATYYNYKNGETIIQLFSVKATDESVRVLFNTCNACNPSPIAILDEDKKIDNDLIIISSNFIESYQSQFENINIYK